MAWLFLSIAVLSNIASNTMFKFAMAAFPQEVTAGTLLRFAFNPHLWLGGLACVLLLGCYLLALREIGLLVSYVFVISLSMVGIGVVSAIVLGEPVSLQSAAGMAFIIAGVTLITIAGQQKTPEQVRAPVFETTATKSTG